MDVDLGNPIHPSGGVKAKVSTCPCSLFSMAAAPSPVLEGAAVLSPCLLISGWAPRPLTSCAGPLERPAGLFGHWLRSLGDGWSAQASCLVGWPHFCSSEGCEVSSPAPERLFARMEFSIGKRAWGGGLV